MAESRTFHYTDTDGVAHDLTITPGPDGLAVQTGGYEVVLPGKILAQIGFRALATVAGGGDPTDEIRSLLEGFIILSNNPEAGEPITEEVFIEITEADRGVS